MNAFECEVYYKAIGGKHRPVDCYAIIAYDKEAARIKAANRSVQSGIKRDLIKKIVITPADVVLDEVMQMGAAA